MSNLKRHLWKRALCLMEERKLVRLPGETVAQARRRYVEKVFGRVRRRRSKKYSREE